MTKYTRWNQTQLYIRSIFRYDKERDEFSGDEKKGLFLNTREDAPFLEMFHITDETSPFFYSQTVNALHWHLLALKAMKDFPSDWPFIRLDILRTFRDTVASAELHMPSQERLDEWQSMRKIDDIGEYNREGWSMYFHRRREQLLTFLDSAIALEEPIEMIETYIPAPIPV